MPDVRRPTRGGVPHRRAAGSETTTDPASRSCAGSRPSTSARPSAAPSGRGRPVGHWQNGSTWAWRRIREQVFAERGRACHLNLDGCTKVATQIHHTQDRDLVGDDPRFLVPACLPCNVRTGDPTDQDPEPNTEW